MGFLNKIIARVGLDGTEFELGAKKVEGVAAHMGENIAHHFKAALAAAFGVAALEEGARHLLEMGVHIADMSRRLGISTDAIQYWDYALKKNGATIDNAAGFFEKLAVARDKAVGNSTKEIESFKKLGVSLDDLKNKRIEDVAENISKVFKAGGDPQNLITALRDIGGKGAGDMVGALTDGISEARHEMQEFGLTIENDVIRRLKQADDDIIFFKRQIEATTAPILASLFESISGKIVTLQAIAAGNKASREVESHYSIPQRMTKMVSDQAEAASKKAFDEVINRAVKLDEARRIAAQHPAKPPTNNEDSISNAERMKELNQRLHEAQERYRLAGLNHAQKILELKRQEKETVEEIIGMENGPDKIEARIRQTNLNIEIQGMLRQNLKYGTELPHADHLAKLGGFVGSAEQSLYHRAYDKMGVMERHLKRISDSMAAYYERRDNSLIDR